MLLLGWLRGVVSSFQNRPSLRLGHLRHLLLLLLTRVRLLQVPRDVTAARHARLLLLTMVSTARTLLLLLVGHRWNSDRIRMMAHSRMLLLRWLLLMLGVRDLRRRALLLHRRRRRRMLSHEGTQIALLLLGETCGGVVQAAKVSEDVLLLVDATFSFPVGGGGVADGAGKLFVFLFGRHFAQNGRWREG